MENCHPVQVTSNIFMSSGSEHLGGISDRFKGLSQTVRTAEFLGIHSQAPSLLARKDHVSVQSRGLTDFSSGQRTLKLESMPRGL